MAWIRVRFSEAAPKIDVCMAIPLIDSVMLSPLSLSDGHSSRDLVPISLAKKVVARRSICRVE